MSLELVEIPDHIEIARERMISQFKDKPNLDALLDIFMTEVQELETTYIDLLLMRGLDTAVGVQLDILGQHVGVIRLGLSDTDYRARLKLQIDINNSDGTESTIASIMLRATDASNVAVLDSGNAFVQVWTDGPVFNSDVQSMLDQITGAAIGKDLRVSPASIPFVFEGDLQGLGLGSIHSPSNGGSLVEHFTI